MINAMQSSAHVESQPSNRLSSKKTMTNAANSASPKHDVRSKIDSNTVSTLNPLQTDTYEGLKAAEIGNIKNAVIDHTMAILILNEAGIIQYCNKRSSGLLGWQSKRLLSQHISKVFPQLAKKPLLKNRELCSRVRFLSRIAHHFDALGQFGNPFKCELFLNYKEYQGHHFLQLLALPVAGPPNRQ